VQAAVADGMSLSLSSFCEENGRLRSLSQGDWLLPNKVFHLCMCLTCDMALCDIFVVNVLIEQKKLSTCVCGGDWRLMIRISQKASILRDSYLYIVAIYPNVVQLAKRERPSPPCIARCFFVIGTTPTAHHYHTQ
jgi:hypothetical protein